MKHLKDIVMQHGEKVIIPIVMGIIVCVGLICDALVSIFEPK